MACGGREASFASRPSARRSGSLTFEPLQIDLLTIGYDQVQHPDRGLIDVVFHRLRLAVENGKPREGDDRGDQTESRAVHRFADAFGEDPRLLARVHAFAT